MKLFRFFLLILTSLLLAGCDKNRQGTIDVSTETPLLSNASASPDSIYIDNLAPVGGLYAISTVARVKMYFRGAGQTLTANVLRPVTAEEVARVSLRDDGISPDQTANDSIYSGNVVFSIQRANAGRYRVQFIATTSEGMISNILEKPLKLSRRNSFPRLYDLNAPDTLQRPTTGSLLFSMTIAAADSDGLQDVQEVVFQNLNSISQLRLPLLDDGGVRQPNGITSGDVAAGDGIYSTIVQLPDTVSPRTFLFKFQARDSFGDTSAAILHNFTVR